MAMPEETRTPVDRALDALRSAGSNVRAAGPQQWTANCPNRAAHANGDKNPSLSVTESPTGKVLFNCHGGTCTVVDIARAAGLSMRDLFPDDAPHPGRETPYGREEARYSYMDEHGEVLYEVVKLRSKDGRKTFRAFQPDGTPSVKGIRRVPYNLPQVIAAVRAGRPVVICEGEKDAENAVWAFSELHAAATCNPFGAGKWSAEYNEHFRGADVIIVADDDAAGRNHATEVFIHLGGVAKTAKILLPAAGCNDLSEHLGAGKTIDELRPIEGDPEPTVDVDDDWADIDLEAVYEAMTTGDWQPTLPTVLMVRNSIPLFYAGRINGIFGESGGGKTWITLAGVLEQIRMGNKVLFIDYEDTREGFVERMFYLGATIEQIRLISYVNPTTAIGRGAEAIEARGSEYAYIVLDSTGESMAAGGVDPNSDAETARWFTILKRLTRIDGTPTIVIVDHIPKATDAPSLFSIGSQRKKAAISGGYYRVDTVKEPAKGRDGRLKLVVAKDRLGNRAKGSTAAIVEIASSHNQVEIDLHLTDAQEAEARGERFRPTVLMERLSRWLELNPQQPKSVVLKAVSGKAEPLRTALEILIEEGWIVVTPGERGSIRCDVQRTFREGEDPGWPVDNSTYVPDGDIRPTYVPGESQDVRPPFPPLQGDVRGRDIGGAPGMSPVDNFDPLDELF
jgi:hypothetical protein